MIMILLIQAFGSRFLEFQFRSFEFSFKNTSRRCDDFGPNIIEIGAILSLFRSFKDFDAVRQLVFLVASVSEPRLFPMISLQVAFVEALDAAFDLLFDSGCACLTFLLLHFWFAPVVLFQFIFIVSLSVYVQRPNVDLSNHYSTFCENRGSQRGRFGPLRACFFYRQT